MNATPDPSTFAGPASIETEQALLGAALISNEVISRVSSLVDIDDFSEDLHRRLWEGMTTLSAEGRIADRLTLHAMIGDTNIGGMTAMQYVARLAAEATTIVNAPSYARSIRDMADKRRALAIGQDIVARAPHATSAADLATEAIQALDAIATRANGNAVPRVTTGQAAALSLDRAADVRAGKKTPYGATWGVRALDRMTLGMHAGELIVVQARPSMGKSSVGVASGLAAANRGTGVYFVSLEMTDMQLGDRALAATAFGKSRDVISYQDIQAGNINDDQWNCLLAAKEKLEALPFEIEQEAGLTLSQIAARARQCKTRMERNGYHLGVVIIDHIGLIAAAGRYSGQRVNEVAEMSAGLKKLAKELGVCVVALSQMNRQSEGRENKRPTLGDLRDSGAIEQDADKVIGLYREDYYLSRKPDLTDEERQRLLDCQNVLEFIVLKQRQGELGTVRAFASMPCNYVGDLQS